LDRRSLFDISGKLTTKIVFHDVEDLIMISPEWP
jgi:hypothetical protein